MQRQILMNIIKHLNRHGISVLKERDQATWGRQKGRERDAKMSPSQLKK